MVGNYGLTVSHDGQYVFMGGSSASSSGFARSILTTPWDITTAGVAVNQSISYNGSTSGFNVYSIAFDALEQSLCFFSVTSTGITTNVDNDDEMKLVQYGLLAITFSGATQDSEKDVGVRGDNRHYLNFADDGSKLYLGERVYVLLRPMIFQQRVLTQHLQRSIICR